MRNHWIAPLLALALTIAPATGLASSHGEEASPAEAFAAVVSSLGDGNVDEAQAAYEDRFQGVAEAPHAEGAVDDALADAAGADPGTAEYKAASQVAKKGLLAISYRAVQEAVAADDAEQAQAHVDVLFTKFDGDEQLADSKAAFADEATGLDEALATLEGELGRLLTAKVYAEATETPELLPDEPATAAKEAGEAAGYALGLRQAATDSLGEDGADKLFEELDGLVEHALASEPDATRAEAEEVRELVAELALQQIREDELDARERFFAALDDGDLDRAETIYEDAFAEHASEYAPEAHDRVQQALEDARQAEGPDLTVQHQILAKSLLAVAWDVGFTELAEDEVDLGAAYLALLVEKLDDRSDPGAIGIQLGHVQASQAGDGAHVDELRAELTSALVDKVHAELDEVFINWEDRETAREKAIEGVLYYQPIDDVLANRLSEEDAEHLDDELRGVYDATTAGDREEAEAEADEAREILDAFANAGRDVSELDRARQEIQRTLGIITVEIEEYEEATAEGDTQTAQEEVAESKAFIRKALSTLEDNREGFEEVDAEAAEALEADMQEIQTRLEAEDNLTAIPDLVDQATQRLASFEASEPAGPAVDVRFGEPEPLEEGFRVPVQLVDVPGGGYSVQATITYDESQLTVDEVEVPAEVGASTTAPGEVRFNAASTDASNQPTIALLHLTPAEGAEPELAIDVETLTDDQGDQLSVGNVSGERLALSSAGEATQPAPGVGLPALVLVGLAAAQLRRRT